MDTVKKDVEDLKLDLHTIKGSIDDIVKLINTLKEINNDKIIFLKEKMVEHTIGFNLLLNCVLKDADKVKEFEEKVKGIHAFIYAAIAAEFFEDEEKEKEEDLQFMSGKH